MAEGIRHIVSAPIIQVDEQHSGVEVAHRLRIMQAVVMLNLVVVAVRHSGYCLVVHVGRPQFVEAVRDYYVAVEIQYTVDVVGQQFAQKKTIVCSIRRANMSVLPVTAYWKGAENTLVNKIELYLLSVIVCYALNQR